MKSFQFNFSLLFILFLTLASCSKDDDNKNDKPTSPVSENGTMKATIGGDEFSADNATARFRSTGEFTLSGSTSDGDKLFFVINGFSGAVDYSFGAGLSNEAQYSYQFNGGTQHFSTADGGNGVLTITQYSESEQLVSGVFSLVVLQTGNLGNSIQITEGSFTNVPIKKLEEPEPGNLAYYADDVYNASFYPNLEMSPLLDIYFGLPAPNGDLTIKLSSNKVEFSVDSAFIISGNQTYDNVQISNFSLVDGKLTIKLKNLEGRDFELWIKEYPVAESNQTGAPGVLTFYTDTAEFVSTNIEVLEYSATNNPPYIGFHSENSNGTDANCYFLTGQSIVVTNFSNEYISGDSKVIFDESETKVSYAAFVSVDSSLVIIGRDIPL